MSKYIINRTADFNDLLSDLNWNKSNKLDIASWPWHKEKYSTPDVTTKLLYSKEYLYVRFDVKENFTQAIHTNFQDMVCEDSCVEFFVSCDNERYFNFEVNAIGTILLRHCKDRNSFMPVTGNEISEIKIETSLPKGVAIQAPGKTITEGYTVAYKIPFSFFAAKTNMKKPTTGNYWQANFYKCGDLTPEPCWGTWSPVETPEPDFHRPEYFGKIFFE